MLSEKFHFVSRKFTSSERQTEMGCTIIAMNNNNNDAMWFDLMEFVIEIRLFSLMDA